MAYKVVRQNIQAQYRDSNVGELIDVFIRVNELFCKRAYDSLENDCLRLTTAKGWALDLWGRLLGFSRYIPDDMGAEAEYQIFNFNNKNFRRLTFANINEGVFSRLDDDNYRMVLLLIYQQMFISADIVSVNAFVKSIFAKISNVAVKDTYDMSYQFFFFGSDIPVWLDWVFKNYDVLPRPAGVGAKWDNVSRYKLAFRRENDVSDDSLGAFYRTNFNK